MNQKAVNQQEKGVDLDALANGTKLEVQTTNTLYTLEKIDALFIITGGPRLTEPQTIRINGSTFGGSMLKTNWLGIGMYMEFVLFKPEVKTLTTSSIRSIKITAHDGSWMYVLQN